MLSRKRWFVVAGVVWPGFVIITYMFLVFLPKVKGIFGWNF